MASGFTFSGPATVSFRGGAGAATAPRGSARRRGYNGAWDMLSKEWRRLHPFCAECAHRGRERRCDLVDHMIPLDDRPDLRLNSGNLWALCKPCHDTVKRGLEAEARASADGVAVLPLWCLHPERRPHGLAYTSKVNSDGRTSGAT